MDRKTKQKSKKMGPMTKEQHLQAEIRDLRKSQKAARSPRQRKVRELGGPDSRQTGTPGRECHKFGEQLAASVPSASAGILITYSFNPGDPSIFPRLNTMAKLYTYWRFKRLKIIYQPNGSAFAANNQTGEIVMSFTDDWYGTPPGTASVARSRNPARAGEAWKPLIISIPNKMLSARRFVRDAATATGGDARLYDVQLNVFVIGTPTAVPALGYILIDGEVELWDDYTPNPLAVNFAPFQNRALCLVQGSQTVSSGVTTQVNWTGSIANTTSALLTGSAFVQGALGSITLSQGTYQITFTCQFTGTTVTSWTLTYTVGGTVVQSSLGDNVANNGLAGSTYAATRTDYIVIAEGQTITVNPFVNVVGTGTLTVTSSNINVVTMG